MHDVTPHFHAEWSPTLHCPIASSQAAAKLQASGEEGLQLCTCGVDLGVHGC